MRHAIERGRAEDEVADDRNEDGRKNKSSDGSFDRLIRTRVRRQLVPTERLAYAEREDVVQLDAQDDEENDRAVVRIVCEISEMAEAGAEQHERECAEADALDISFRPVRQNPDDRQRA